MQFRQGVLDEDANEPNREPLFRRIPLLSFHALADLYIIHFRSLCKFMVVARFWASRRGLVSGLFNDDDVLNC